MCMCTIQWCILASTIEVSKKKDYSKEEKHELRIMGKIYENVYSSSQPDEMSWKELHRAIKDGNFSFNQFVLLTI